MQKISTEQLDIYKVLIPFKSYDFKLDKRLIIPFSRYGEIGMSNPDGEIIISPRYDAYSGECYREDDYIKVAKYYLCGTPENKRDIGKNLKLLWGVIDFKGEEVLPIKYTSIKQAVGNANLFTVQKTSYQWGVINQYEQEVIPFGIYTYIGGYSKGFARAKKIVGLSNGIIEEKWGIIDEDGKVVKSFEYDRIGDFYKNNYSMVHLTKGGKREIFKLK